MKGFFGKLLRIDLNRKNFNIENIDIEIFENYLGGKGLATHLLLKEGIYEVDPLSEENKIIFATGPITDTQIWGSSRYGIFTKSPLTNYYLESYSGGNVGQFISRTGFDVIILEGKSNNPIYIEINEDNVKFHDAENIWGKGTYETEKILKDKNCGVISIGPAGENLVKIALIENNFWRSAGRGGAGAVLGSKNVKAIVFKGNKKREVFSEEEVIEFSKNILKIGKDNAGVKAYKNFGTPMMVAILNSVKAFPTKYWHKGELEGWEDISADKMKEILNSKPKACPKCFMACGKLSKFNGNRLEGPEYETIYAFGGLCMIKDIKEIAEINDLCDNLGIDTISAGNLVAFTMEASSLGKIDYKINFGDAEKTKELIEMIVYRKGIGDILANGIKFVAKEWGLENIAIHVKGMEPAGYDPRVLKGMSLAYSTSPRGACHLRSTFYKAELAGLIDKDKIEGKAELFIDFENRLAIHDALIVCRFYRDLYMWDELCKIVNITTGLNVNKNSLENIANNIVNLTREFNIKCGLTKNDDSLPDRFFNESIENGNLKKSEFKKLLYDYYELRGWN